MSARNGAVLWTVLAVMNGGNVAIELVARRWSQAVLSAVAFAVSCWMLVDNARRGAR